MERLVELKKRLAERCPALELREGEPMSKHTTFRIGGPAALMALPGTMEEVQTVFKTAAELDVEPFFLGNGSNLLVSDAGYRGVVIQIFKEMEDSLKDELWDGSQWVADYRRIRVTAAR